MTSLTLAASTGRAADVNRCAGILTGGHVVDNVGGTHSETRLASLHRAILQTVSAGKSELPVISPNGELIATPSGSTGVVISDASTGNKVLDLVGYKSFPGTSVVSSFSRDSRFLVMRNSSSKEALMWDLTSGRVSQKFKLQTGWFKAVEFSPDGRTLLSTSNDSSTVRSASNWNAKIWDIESGELSLELVGHRNKINSAKFSNDGSKIVTASDDGSAIIWDATTGSALRVMRGQADRVYSASFSPDGKQVVTASDKGQVLLLDTSSGAKLHSLTGHNGLVTIAEFSRDGQMVMTGASDGSVIVWNALTGEMLKRFDFDGSIKSAVLDQDASRLLVVSKPAIGKAQVSLLPIR
jgi:WD40 repeat protein